MSANRIWIQLSKDIYTCGEPIQGTLNVICNSVQSGKSLKFKLKGKEHTKWVKLNHLVENPQQPLNIPDSEIDRVNDVALSDDSSDSDDEVLQAAVKQVFKKRDYRYIRNNTNQLYEVKRGHGNYRIINQVQDLGQLTPGHHSFPFQFNSAQNWPGSFLSEQNKEKGKIKYTLTGYYGSQKQQVEFYMQEFKASQSGSSSSRAKISAWCCLSQGVVKMDVSFAKDSLYIGEEQQVKIKLDCTELSCNITTLNVALYTHLIYRSDDGQTNGNTFTVFNKSIQGCIAKGVKEFEEKFIVSFPQSISSNRPSVNGSKISSTYRLSVSASDDASCSCCSDTLSAGNDTHIYSKPSNPSSSQVIVDPSFRPQVHPILNIAIVAPTQKAYSTVSAAINQIIPFNQPNNGGMQQPVMNNQFQQPTSQNQPLNSNQGMQQQGFNNQPQSQFNGQLQNNNQAPTYPPQQNGGISSQPPVYSQPPQVQQQYPQQQNNGLQQNQNQQNLQNNGGIGQQAPIYSPSPVIQQQYPPQQQQQQGQFIGLGNSQQQQQGQFVGLGNQQQQAQPQQQQGQFIGLGNQQQQSQHQQQQQQGQFVGLGNQQQSQQQPVIQQQQQQQGQFIGLGNQQQQQQQQPQQQQPQQQQQQGQFIGLGNQQQQQQQQPQQQQQQQQQQQGQFIGLSNQQQQPQQQPSQQQGQFIGFGQNQQQNQGQQGVFIGLGQNQQQHH